MTLQNSSALGKGREQVFKLLCERLLNVCYPWVSSIKVHLWTETQLAVPENAETSALVPKNNLCGSP